MLQHCIILIKFKFYKYIFCYLSPSRHMVIKAYKYQNRGFAQ